MNHIVYAGSFMDALQYTCMYVKYIYDRSIVATTSINPGPLQVDEVTEVTW
jgi:hypothetical protein